MVFCFVDLVWLKASLPFLNNLPDPFLDCMPWYSLITDLTKEFFKYVDNAVDNSCFSVPVVSAPPKVCTVVCDICGVKLSNTQELSAHNWLVHSAKSCFRKRLTPHIAAPVFLTFILAPKFMIILLLGVSNVVMFIFFTCLILMRLSMSLQKLLNLSASKHCV